MSFNIIDIIVPVFHEEEGNLQNNLQAFKKNALNSNFKINVHFFIDGTSEQVNHAAVNYFSQMKGNSVDLTGDHSFRNKIYLTSEGSNCKFYYCSSNQNIKKKGVLDQFFEYLCQKYPPGKDKKVFALIVDSDSVIIGDAIDRCGNELKDNPKLGGVCAEVRVANKMENLWTLIQHIEYSISHILTKQAESYFDCVTCLPGAFAMIRVSSIKLVLDDFLDRNGSMSFFESNKKRLGEDRYLTTLLLLAGQGTRYVSDAVCETNVHASLFKFVTQRRRWDNSTLVNQIVLLKKIQFKSFGKFLIYMLTFLEMLLGIIGPAITIYLICSMLSTSVFYCYYPINLYVLWALVGGINTLFGVLLPFVKDAQSLIACYDFLCPIIGLMGLFSVLYFFWTAGLVLGLTQVGLLLVPFVIIIFKMGRYELIALLPLYFFLLPISGSILKFYTLVNFDDTTWGSRGDKSEQKKDRTFILVFGMLYLVINFGVMVLIHSNPDILSYFSMAAIILCLYPKLLFSILKVNQKRYLLGICIVDSLLILVEYLVTSSVFASYVIGEIFEVNVLNFTSTLWLIVFSTFIRCVLICFLYYSGKTAKNFTGAILYGSIFALSVGFCFVSLLLSIIGKEDWKFILSKGLAFIQILFFVIIELISILQNSTFFKSKAFKFISICLFDIICAFGTWQIKMFFIKRSLLEESLDMKALLTLPWFTFLRWVMLWIVVALRACIDFSKTFDKVILSLLGIFGFCGAAYNLIVIAFLKDTFELEIAIPLISTSCYTIIFTVIIMAMYYFFFLKSNEEDSDDEAGDDITTDIEDLNEETKLVRKEANRYGSVSGESSAPSGILTDKDNNS